MEEKTDYEKLFEGLKNKEDFGLYEIFLLMVVFLLFFGFNNCAEKEESKTTININLKGSDINV